MLSHLLISVSRNCLLAYLVLVTTCLSSSIVSSQENGFQPLFDGMTLEGWHGNNPHTTAKAKPAQVADSLERQQQEFLQHWRVEDGELVNDGKGPYATTDSEFGDIELQLEYKTVAKADSGIYLRGTPQVQIWDTTEEGGKWNRNANYGSGGLFNNLKGAPGQLPLRHADRPFGAWNHFRILQVGSRTWVELNRQLVVDGAVMQNYWDKQRQTPLPAKGPIHLQTHGGEIRWRSIRVRSIGSEEAISRLRGDDVKFGFTPIFNGKDLAGWTGATGDYEVKDGSIVCLPGRGGVLYTEEEYENFVVRVEFRLPPGGNNGLAIRYPGKGSAAYDGMCELQVLDNEAAEYANLDPRQYHGSVYGVAPAARGYLRPAGDWNYQEVTVDGSHIRVELNGTTIVDTDVSEINEYKDGRPHPGLSLTRGHFGFAGHNDPVEFRRIAIKQLPRSKPKQIPLGEVFHASFDDTTDANLSTNDGFVLASRNTGRTEVLNNYLSELKILPGHGVQGDALHIPAKPELVYFYPGDEVNYSERDWSGSLSVWMKLDPDRDLEPGFCDPIQITSKKWNDAAIFLDFDKELPRDFRLGVFSDYAFWNPKDTPWEQVKLADRPMIVVSDPPFSADRWTHVCFTWQGINTDGNAVIKLYLNSVPVGQLKRPMKFTWDRERIALMLGIHYVGQMDELRTFDRALTADQVRDLFELESP